MEPAAGQAAVSTIMATWTPNKTLLERRVNVHLLALLLSYHTLNTVCCMGIKT